MSAEAPLRQPMSWRRIRLIARREIRERMAQKVYRVVLVVGALFVAGVVVVPTLFDGGDDGPERTTVPVAFEGIAAAEARARATGLERAALAAGGGEIRVRVLRDAAAAREAVRENDDRLALIVSGSPAAPVVTVVQRPNGLVDTTDVLAALQRSATEARLAALPAAERTRALAPVTTTTQTVDAAGATPAAAAIVGVMTLVLYLVGLLLNTAFANGVVSDRSGRIVERLLTAARPEEHLLGKLLGVGGAGLIQFAAWIAAGALAALIVAGELRDTFDGVPVLLLIWFPISVVLTYVLYAALAAVFVIPVRRIEDVAGALAIGSMFQIVAYIAATTILPPGSTVGPTVQALSLVPFFSPLIMLPRIAAGDVAGWELAVGALGPLLLAAVLIRLAAPAYARHAIEAPGGKGLGAALKALRG